MVTGPGLRSTYSTSGVSPLPILLLNAPMAPRVTGSAGQYSVPGTLHPSVMLRFFSHSTLGQNGSDARTSVNPTQLWAWTVQELAISTPMIAAFLRLRLIPV